MMSTDFHLGKNQTSQTLKLPRRSSWGGEDNSLPLGLKVVKKSASQPSVLKVRLGALLRLQDLQILKSLKSLKSADRTLGS